MSTLHRPLAALAIAALCALSGTASAAGISRNHVYTSSNDPAGNALLVYSRGQAGSLTLTQTLPTQGLGTGTGLGSQGAVTLSQDGQFLFVVNAGSHSVSSFRLSGDGAAWASTVDTAGDKPISVTESHGVVYVLNAGGDGNVAGFYNNAGQLQPIANSVRPLSGAGVGPAQVSFDRLGRTLVVSEKASNLLSSWPVRPLGTLGTASQTPSAGATPFGFSFSDANVLLVSEAQGGAPLVSSLSSYRLVGQRPHAPQVVTPALSTQQTAACWTAVTPDGRFVYTANTGSDSLSSYRVMAHGALKLQASVAQTQPGAHPLDLAVNPNGNRLYALNNGLAQVASYRIGAAGQLSPSTAVSVPATAVGLAAD